MSGIPYGPEEDAIIRALFPVNNTAVVARLIDRTHSSVVQRAAILGAKKSPGYLAERAGRKNGHEPGSVAHRFKPGQVPANKGLRRPGWAPGRMASTQFKKGAMAGAAQHNYVPIGSERISKDGYLERKVTDDPALAPARRWVGVHRLVWEAVNGPVPTGHAVVFLPGRKTADAARIAPDGLELVSRAELMRRNTRHRFPPELNQLLSLKAALTRKINSRSKLCETK